eukprot:4362491-Ditylum_brightwellii.AAC.2
MAPSNATMSNLASAIALMRDYLEKHQAIVSSEKDQKKNSFAIMMTFAQQMILFASTTDCRTATKRITPEFKLILEQ